MTTRQRHLAPKGRVTLLSRRTAAAVAAVSVILLSTGVSSVGASPASQNSIQDPMQGAGASKAGMDGSEPG
ncbi:MAG: hypothetical protein V2A71_00035, partial [Candidatus Eisenbacteria bacterium]